MSTILQDYLEQLAGLHAEIHRAIAGLPPAALDWKPGPDMNSLGVLAVHVAGSERYWIGEVAGGDPAGRDRDAEFRTHGLDEAALTTRLTAALAHSRTTLEGLTLPELEARRIAPRDGREYTAAWGLFHALEHTALHLGQMQLTRQLWDQRHHQSD